LFYAQPRYAATRVLNLQLGLWVFNHPENNVDQRVVSAHRLLSAAESGHLYGWYREIRADVSTVRCGPFTTFTRSIRQFGFTNPVLIDRDNVIIAGHGRVEVAKQLAMASIPTLCLDHLSAAEVRAYVIADNHLAELAGWNTELLALELGELIELDFDVHVTGFETAERQ
jgi:hypothetical protein